MTSTAVEPALPVQSAQLPAYARPVMCQNMTKGPLIICSSPKGDDETRFAGNGDPDGNDVQPIPSGLLAAPQFASSLQKGTLKVVAGDDNPIVVAALQRQTDAFWKKYDQEQKVVMDSMESVAANDMIAVQCIGPGTRAGTQCETQIPVWARAMDATAPLCDAHQHLKSKVFRRGDGPWQLEH
jgi:hypothetical protein